MATTEQILNNVYDSDSNAIRVVVVGPTPVNFQTGTNYTLVASDAEKIVDCSNGSAFTLSVPADSSVNFPVGTQVSVVRAGPGAVSVTGGGSVTVEPSASLSIANQFSAAQLYKRAADSWVLVGDLT